MLGGDRAMIEIARSVLSNAVSGSAGIGVASCVFPPMLAAIHAIASLSLVWLSASREPLKRPIWPFLRLLLSADFRPSIDAAVSGVAQPVAKQPGATAMDMSRRCCSFQPFDFVHYVNKRVVALTTLGVFRHRQPRGGRGSRGLPSVIGSGGHSCFSSAGTRTVGPCTGAIDSVSHPSDTAAIRHAVRINLHIG